MFFLTITMLILCLTIANSVIANDTQKQKVVWIKVNYNIQESVNLVRNWINGNPDKQIVSITSDSLGFYGDQRGWLIIYTDKNKEKDGCSR